MGRFFFPKESPDIVLFGFSEMFSKLFMLTLRSSFDGLLGALHCFFLSLQGAEWHCDEFTKGACFSRGKSEVNLSDA